MKVFVEWANALIRGPGSFDGMDVLTSRWWAFVGKGLADECIEASFRRIDTSKPSGPLLELNPALSLAWTGRRQTGRAASCRQSSSKPSLAATASDAELVSSARQRAMPWCPTA